MIRKAGVKRGGFWAPGGALVLTLLAWASVAAEPAAIVQDYRQLQYSALRDMALPRVERVTLPNGMRLLLLEDRELPLISLSARIRVGSVQEPPEKTGLAALTGAIMRTGGTDTRTGDEIDEELERMAGSVETSIGLDCGYASMSILAEDLDRGLALLADVLMHPAFREDKVRLAKGEVCSGIARRNDSLDAIARREFDKLIYAPRSPYARHVEYATVDNITRSDMVAFHQKYFGPNRVIMAVWGDVAPKDAVEKIRAAFASWKPVDADFPEMPPVRYDYRTTINLIRRTDTNQSIICLGHIGGWIQDPNYFAVAVMNQILDSDFTGRFFRNIRSRQGLAYSIGGSYGMGYSYPGVFCVRCQTRSGATVRAIRAMIEEIVRINRDGATPAELADAKEGYLNSFIFHFDTRGKMVNRLMTYEYYGYPADFLQRTKQGIEQVTATDVARVAREYLHPDKLQILVVGRPDEFDEPLSVLGEVHEIDITIPVPKR